MQQRNRSGVVWRPLTTDDLDPFFELYQHWETDLDLPYRTSRDEIEHEMAEPETDLERDTLVAADGDGRLLASAWLTARSRPGLKHRAFVMTMALRDFADLEVDALRWAERAARERFAGFEDAIPRVIRGFSAATATSRIDRYESCGFEVVRYFVDMVRPLEGAIADPAMPNGVELVGWDDRWARSTFDAQVESFADHWGSLPSTWEDFQHRLTWPGTRLDLSMLAIAGGEVVSFALNGVYPQDFEVRGRTEGWIDTLGTRRAWRKQGLASALINESLRRFAAEGLEYAGLDVDAASPTGAFGLYERLGFVEQSRSLSLMKDLGVVSAGE